jgi:histidinol-phosphate/aromatic aminotransferase/cobyric acid decarboxylase-like protein
VANRPLFTNLVRGLPSTVPFVGPEAIEPSAANFVAFDLGTRDRAQAVMQALAERGVFVRTPGTPPLDRLVRVTVAPEPQRADFAEVFAEATEKAAAGYF